MDQATKDKIVELRSLGMSQREVACRLGISHQSVHYWSSEGYRTRQRARVSSKRMSFEGRIKDNYRQMNLNARNLGHAECITPVEVVIDAFDGRCQCCGEEPDKSLHLDHCHKTGIFRGWLCSGCNTALGMCRERPELLVCYLEGAPR